MNNLVVQLLLKTGTFSQDLKQARGQIQNFQQGCQTAGKSLGGFTSALGINVGALTKMGGAVGIAVAAGKELKAILETNQTTADAFEGAIAGCKGALDAFNQAIAMADFSAFREGLWNVIQDAKSFRDAMDDLGDANWAYGYKSNQFQSQFNDARNAFDEPDATREMKESAIKQMEDAVNAQWDAANKLGKKQMDAYVKAIVKEAGSANINAKDITMAQFNRAADIKLSENSSQLIEQLNSQYKDYQREMKEFGKNNITAQENLKKKYADVIATRAIVNSMNDKELEVVVGIANEMETSKRQAESMERTLNRAKKRLDDSGTSGGSSVTKTLKEEMEIMDESLTSWNKIAQEAKKHRDAQVFNSESWNEYNDILTNANEQMKKINEQTDLLIKKQEQLAKGTIAPVNAPNLQGKADTKIQTGLDGKVIDTKMSVNEIQNLISELEKLRDELKEGDPQIAAYNKRIQELGNTANAIKSAGIEVPAVQGETISTWDSFNQAMSNTSTIVSSLTNTFKEGTEVTAASVLSMVSTALPAVGSLITAINALATAEAVEAGVAATGKAVSTSKHWIEAIAAVAALGAVVAAAISSAKNAKFANGGIVPGTSYTGDRVVANVNSGEMILNKAQQANLFKIANGGMGGSREVEFHISGTELVGVLNNFNRKNRVTG